MAGECAHRSIARTAAGAQCPGHGGGRVCGFAWSLRSRAPPSPKLEDKVAGFAEKAIAGRAVADAVAAHKSWFFPEKDPDRQTIDYRAAVAGGLRLVPKGTSREALSDDYARMVEDGLLLDEAEPFDELMARVDNLEARANAAAAAGAAGE